MKSRDEPLGIFVRAYDAKAHLSELLEKVEGGQEIIITSTARRRTD